MSISLRALEYLRARESPFADKAEPQESDERFLDRHVPEYCAEAQRLLFESVD